MEYNYAQIDRETLAIQDTRSLFNVGLHVNLITLAHPSYFPTNKCKVTRHKTNLFSVFHYLALMYKSEPPQFCYYNSIFANI